MPLASAGSDGAECTSGGKMQVVGRSMAAMLTATCHPPVFEGTNAASIRHPRWTAVWAVRMARAFWEDRRRRQGPSIQSP